MKNERWELSDFWSEDFYAGAHINDTQAAQQKQPYEETKEVDFVIEEPFVQEKQYTESPPSKKRRHPAGIAGFLVLCMGFGFFGGYLSNILFGGRGTVFYQAPEGVQTVNTASDQGANLSVQQLIKNVQNSVVEVRTESVVTGSFLGQGIKSGAGSGVIISEDGYILTNNHVVSVANKVVVTLSDGTEHVATVIGSDSQSDIAVLKIDASGLSVAVFGDSDALQVGDFSIVIGNPLGSLGGTVTDGIISALNRDITIDGTTMNLLQTNAAVNPGNSGGGLFNSRGELIGIINAKSSGSDVEGLGFAIPINNAKKVAEEIITNGYVTGRPSIGIMVIDVNSAERAMTYGVSKFGVYIDSVNDGSEAKAQGLQRGDYIVSINGSSIEGTADITAELSKHQVGDEVEIQVIRDGKTLIFKVKLIEKQPEETTG